MIATTQKPVETQLANAVWIARAKIHTADQPREYFAPDAMKDLKASIAEHGLLQPLIIAYEPSRYDGRPYRIVAGERRFRASEGILEDLPCLLRDAGSGTAKTLALIENLQREDLTAIEEARGVADLIKSQNLSLRSAARALSKSSGWINNRLSLLKTGKDVQEVAARNPLTTSSLLLIDAIKDKETRAELLEQVEAGAPHSAIKIQVEKHQTELSETKARTRNNGRAPDASTHQRQIAFENNGTPNVSRGKQLKGNTATEARHNIEAALQTIEIKIETIEHWRGLLSETQMSTLAARLSKLGKRIGELP